MSQKAARNPQHDQIANSAHGLRLHFLTDPGNYGAMTAVLLLAPGTPMLFQGQEFAASSPFYYFADHKPELAKLVAEGRKEYFKHFLSLATPEMQAGFPEPNSLETFKACKLNLSERISHAQAYTLHRDLLRLRHHDPVFCTPRLGQMGRAVLSSDAFALRYFGDNQETHLILVNFRVDLSLAPAPEPLLAPPEGADWEVLWSSENPRYGGSGMPPLSTDHQWQAVGHVIVVLIPKKK